MAASVSFYFWTSFPWPEQTSEEKIITIPIPPEVRNALHGVIHQAVGAGGKPLACRTLFVSKIPVLETLGSWHGNEAISI